MNDIMVDPARMALVTGILLAFGKGIKEIPRIPNALIPIILSVLGGVGYAAVTAWTGVNVMLGIYAGVGAVGLHQNAVQLKQVKEVAPLVVGLCALILTGCASKGGVGNDQQPQPTMTPDRAQWLAQDTVMTGLTYALIKKPELRSDFLKAQRGIAALVKQSHWDFLAMKQALSGSGAEKFNSLEAQLILTGSVTGVTVLIDLVTGERLDVRGPYAEAVIRGIHAGFESVLGPVPE